MISIQPKYLVLTLAAAGAGGQIAPLLEPRLWPLGWAAIGCYAAMAQVDAPRRWAAGGWLGAIAAVYWLGFPWHFECAQRTLPGGPWAAPFWVLPVTLFWAIPERLPVAMAWLLARKWSLPAWLWFPLAWWAGEALWDGFAGVTYQAWLYGQVGSPLVLRAVGAWGWNATLLACLVAAAALGQAAATRAWRPLPVAALALGFLFVAPPLDPGPTGALDDVAVVSMSGFGERPQEVPPSTKLMIWPEGITARKPRLEEGPAHGEALEAFLPAAAGVTHVFGAHIRSQVGVQNALVAVDERGRAIATRAKSRLFPLMERPWLGFSLPGAESFVAGVGPPLLDVADRRCTALLCLEELDRALVRQGAAAGATLIVVSANDAILGTMPLAHRQLLATAIFRAVEAHAPLARASIFGVAALIGADGRILAESPPGSSGVLIRAGATARTPGSR